MKTIGIYLSSIKSGCFMLVACFVLSVAAVSCSDDYLESGDPDGQKELSKEEWIRLMQERTRAGNSTLVMIVTAKQTVTIGCSIADSVAIDWGDNGTVTYLKRDTSSIDTSYDAQYYSCTYTFSNDRYHGIFLEGNNETLRRLDLDSNAIDVLIFMENKKLETLSCSGNNITEGLDLSDCSNLRSVNAANSELTSIKVSSPNLETLDCYNNEISQLDLSGCGNLERVYASDNHLSSIDVSSSYRLKVLSIDNNDLTNIDLSGNPNLLALSVTGNKYIKGLDLSKNTRLSTISLIGLIELEKLNGLPISGTSFAVFPRLQELHIANTPFDSLDLSGNPSLLILNISSTPITRLDISGSHIRDLYATGSGLTNLIYTPADLQNAYNLGIEGTPFETTPTSLYRLLAALPDRSTVNEYGQIIPGNLYITSSSLVTPFLSLLTSKNWIVDSAAPMRLAVRNKEIGVGIRHCGEPLSW